ncbi:MAG: 7,8-didemethyl-8-hydroxy-5-deazariboflavin synthase subunit CofG [Methanolinea sp.]|nr:7,8-didemethyl-8-hydroxy-5-deazariboflavin synthase subunit CofG [Methanolinea sp.]
MQSRVITFSRNVFLPLTTVCHNRCGYCSFRTPVREGCVMPPGEVTATLREGSRLGCTEALFTFGERPGLEPGFRAHLSRLGYSDILGYCYEMAERAIDFGLLPHTNAGILTLEEMEWLSGVNASMGLMLETTARVPAHENSPGKDPAVRIEVIENAGKLRIPFTTGILLGIGESVRDREESLTTIRDIHRRYGHIQEVIVQNFCPKEGTPMARHRPVSTQEMCETIRMAREILPREVAVQVPPNLADVRVLVPCGADDLGGISPLTIDYVNPEHSWPRLDELRRQLEGYCLVERLCIYPRFIEKGWYPERLKPLITRLHKVIQDRSKACAEG